MHGLQFIKNSELMTIIPVGDLNSGEESKASNNDLLKQWNEAVRCYVVQPDIKEHYTFGRIIG